MSGAATLPVAKAPVWFITGCSTGIGRETALAALARGDRVIATARQLIDVADLAEKGAATIILDITKSDEEIQKAVVSGVKSFGTVDILVNNAGVGFNGIFEETSDKEFRAHFDINFFGQLSVTRAILPYMRAQRSGAIGFIGSMCGWISEIRATVYSSAKFALAGLAQNLREEVKRFGIKVTVIEPGHFRTQIAAPEKLKYMFPRDTATLEDYGPMNEGLRSNFVEWSGTQPGDPEICGRVIFDALTGSGAFHGKELPARLLLGVDAVTEVKTLLEDQVVSVREWESVSVSTDFSALE